MRLFISVKYIHSEECQQALAAVVFDSAVVCQLFYKNAVGGHAGILQLRKPTGFSPAHGAGRAEGAAAGSYHKSIAAGGTELLDKPNAGGIVAAFAHGPVRPLVTGSADAHFLRPVCGSTMKCVATLVKAGRTMARVQLGVYDENDKLCTVGFNEYVYTDR